MSNKKYRRQRMDSGSEEEDTNTSSVKDMLETKKELMKIRKRPNGINAASLALGAKVTKMEELTMEKDPFKIKTGGLTNMRGVKDRNRDRTYEDVDRDVTNLGSTFSQETNRRDTDAQLTTYIESQMKIVKGNDDDRDGLGSKFQSAEDQLYQLPEHLQIKVNKRSEEMLSNQMLSGIPEVDLGIESKIKNIERTEQAKVELITEMHRKKEKKASFVPINMAVNYVQHKRYMHNNSGGDHYSKRNNKKPEQPEELPPLVVGDLKQRLPEQSKPMPKEGKSTDNFHFEKFRKNSRYR